MMPYIYIHTRIKIYLYYIYIYLYIIYIRIHTHIFPTVWLVIGPVSQPVNSCGFFVSKHHPPSLSEKRESSNHFMSGFDP